MNALGNGEQETIQGNSVELVRIDGSTLPQERLKKVNRFQTQPEVSAYIPFWIAQNNPDMPCGFTTFGTLRYPVLLISSLSSRSRPNNPQRELR